MMTKTDLQGAFGSLLDTLQNRLDPFQPEDVVGRWTGIIAKAGAIGRAGGWNALPDQRPDYDQVVAALNTATSALASADYADSDSVHAALDLVDGALGALGGLVGR